MIIEDDHFLVKDHEQAKRVEWLRSSPACFSSLSLTLQLIQGALSTNRMGKVEDR